MSQSSSLNERVISDDKTSRTYSKDLAEQAAGVNLDLMDVNPVTPALTKGPHIMPHLNNETIKYVFGWMGLTVERNLGERVGSYSTLFLQGFRKSRRLMKERH